MKKIIFAVFLISSLMFSRSSGNKKVGVALAGGGALGFAHIGALEVMDSLGIPIDYVAGTSMGGLVGAFVAMGYSPEEIEKIVLNEIQWTDIFSDTPSRSELPFIEKEAEAKEQLVLKLTNNYIPRLPDGFLEGQNIYLTLLKYTTPFEATRDFSKLPIPLRVVAVDLVSGDEVVLKDGSLAFAMRSTMSIPTVFSPTEYRDGLLIDGGVINNFPVDVVKEMGADVVIGLNLTAPLKKKEELTDLMSILNRTTDIPRFSVLNKNIQLSDIYIPQNIEGYTPGDFDHNKIKELIKRGRKAAYEHLDELLALKKEISEDTGGEPVVKIHGAKFFTETQIKNMLGIKKGEKTEFASVKKRAEFFSLNPFVKSLEVRKDNGKIDVFVEEEPQPLVIDYDFFQSGRQTDTNDKMFDDVFKPLKNKPLNLDLLFDKIRYLYSFGYFKTIRYEVFNEGDNKIRLLFDVSTNYMKEIFLSVHYDDYYQFVGLAGLKVNSSLIPGLRWDVVGMFMGVVGVQSKLSFPSRSLDKIFYPFWTFKYADREQDLYYSFGATSFGKYYYKTLSNKIGLGITPSRFLNLELGYNMEWDNIRSSVGLIGFEDMNFHLNEYFAALKLDALDNYNFPQNGIFSKAEAYLSKEELGSHYTYMQISFLVDIYRKLGLHGFRLNGYYFLASGDEPFPRIAKNFGGPNSFIGWDYSAALFRKISFIRAEYHLNFIGNLYFDVYANTVFNYSLYFYDPEIGLPDKNAYYGAGVGFTYNSIAGPVRIIWAWGDDNVIAPRKMIKRVYFTLGVKIDDLLE